ncbi:beta-class carbonic anhydrase [Blastococcus sp. SYSU DS0510]
MAEIDRMLEANAEWAERFPGSKPVAPARKVAVVACMDSRMPLFPLLGLEVGDAHVIRNAGGVVTEDTVRSLTISQHLLGTREIVLVHHTDCGLQKSNDVDFADLVERATGRRPPWSARTFTDVDADVRESMRLLRDCPYLVSHEVRGTVYDVDTGRLREVKDPAAPHRS